MNVKTIDIAEIEGAFDIALVVNGAKIATVDPDFEEDGSVSNMDDLAHALADVIGISVRYVRINSSMEIFQATMGDYDTWTWDMIIPAVWVAGKEHTTQFLREQPGVTFVRTDGDESVDYVTLCQRNGVRLVETEVFCMWDWISQDGKKVSEAAFPSEIEAAEDAVKTLDLK